MRRKKGAVTVEFAMVGIPLIFAMISIVEMARGVWTYYNQAYAVNGTLRYVVVHGADCTTSGNSCTVTIGNIATQLATLGIGLAPTSWDVKFISATSSNSVTCNPLSSCLSNTTVWPPSPDNKVGSRVGISATYPFSTSLAMFWPGASPTHFNGAFSLPAYSQQLMQF